VNTGNGATSGCGPDAGFAGQSDIAGTEQSSMPVSDEIKQDSDYLLDSVKTGIENAVEQKSIPVASSAADSDATASVNSTAQSESDAPVADVTNPDVSDVKCVDPILKEEEDALENDEQNADGKQSTQYWNYHWPKVCDNYIDKI